MAAGELTVGLGFYERTSMTLIKDLEEQIRSRMQELQPYVDEYAKLEALLPVLADAPTRTPSSRAHRRIRSSRRDSGGRGAEALRIIRGNPGVTVSQLAGQLGIGPTYLYKILPALERDGLVEKVGRGYRATTPAESLPVG